MVLARVVIHVLARVLPHVLARVLLHVLARVIIHVHDYYSKTCHLDALSDLKKNVPRPKLSLLAGLVVQVDASAGETSAHSRGNWEEDEQ